MQETQYTIDDVVMILIKQTQMLARIGKTIEDIFKIQQEDSRLDGTTITNIFTLPAGAPVLKIDFIEAKHVNVPAGVSLDVPLVPVQQIIINNLGPATIFLSTNKTLNQLEAASQVLSGGTRTISLAKRAIKQLNLVSSGGAAKIQVEVLV